MIIELRKYLLFNFIEFDCIVKCFFFIGWNVNIIVSLVLLENLKGIVFWFYVFGY